jgi:hypothetical protein
MKRFAYTILLGLLAAGCGGSSNTGSSCTGCAGGGNSGGGGGNSGGSAGNGGGGGAGGGCIEGCGPTDPPPPSGGGSARVVAYVNCLCGFGAGDQGGACLANPDPAVNHVQKWEDDGVSPITHYIISFLSFQGAAIRTDPGSIWADEGGSTSKFELEPHLKAAMLAAQKRGKKIVLSLGGEAGSSGFLNWWSSAGADSEARVAGMRGQLKQVAKLFEQQNGIRVDGFDVDIELGAVYQYNSDKYVATRDLVDAVPENLIVAFVPQVGNGLCAAPAPGDPLSPPTVMGGQCAQPVMGDDTPWALARLDKECRRSDGSPKLDYWGIQYYNAGQADCCGGGADDNGMVTSAMQSYKNLANGWAASGDTTQPGNPWHQYAYYPGPWAPFDGIGADRLVLGKPGCKGCAGSDYLDIAAMQKLISQLDNKLTKPMGGILFWDLCRLFGNAGPQCVSGQCQPSWGGSDVLTNLTQLRKQMASLRTR